MQIYYGSCERSFKNIIHEMATIVEHLRALLAIICSTDSNSSLKLRNLYREDS